MTSGSLNVRIRKMEAASKREKKQPKPGTYQYFIRGFNYSGSKVISFRLQYLYLNIDYYIC